MLSSPRYLTSPILVDEGEDKRKSVKPKPEALILHERESTFLSKAHPTAFESNHYVTVL